MSKTKLVIPRPPLPKSNLFSNNSITNDSVLNNTDSNINNNSNSNDNSNSSSSSNLVSIPNTNAVTAGAKKATSVIEGEYKGNATFGIKYDDSTSSTPLISFGYNKAVAILRHIDELAAWVEKQENLIQPQKPMIIITSDQLTPEQYLAIQAMLQKK